MAQMLACHLGLAVGISSGANVIGAIMLRQELGNEANVVTILSDSNKKYLSTDLMKVEPVRSGYLSSNIQLIDYHPICRISSSLPDFLIDSNC
jgi:cysteine synthase A